MCKRNAYRYETARKLSEMNMKSPPFCYQGVFPFLKLPAELRRRVLCFTNLVVPGNHISYDFYSFIPPEEDPSARLCPWRDFGYDFFESHLHDLRFCSRWFSAYSRHCHCWFPEMAIMRCSKQMYRESMEIFFDVNTFEEPHPPWLASRRLEPSARKPRARRASERRLDSSESSTTVKDEPF